MIEDPVLKREWYPIACSKDLNEGQVLPARVMDEDLVLWRSKSAIMIWQDLCIHRGAKLSLGKVTADNCLQCPYHGWIYDQTGTCVKIPAHPNTKPPGRAHTHVYQAREEYGFIWVCLSDDPAPFPEFPEWNRPGFVNFNQGPVRIHALGPRIIENFLDLSHLPILHAGILGVPERAEIGKYTVKTDPKTGVYADDIHIWQPDGDGSGEGDMAEYTYSVPRPLAAYLTKKIRGGYLSILIVATPVDRERSLASLVFATRSDVPAVTSVLVEWADRILAQDIPVVESQRPERLPLDLQAELHLPCDRTSIAYRQWINELKVSFGTS
jgi:phenylpropionate dioxygenase-like ring-hydroxylating dioxygenase large terminal subunit